MNKLLILLISCFILTGCSLIPKINFGTPSTVPQTIDKSKAKVNCQGEAKFNEQGDMIYCSKGFYDYSENYAKKERKMTIVEKIKQFVMNLTGWSFWIFVGLIIFCPSLVGVVLGRFIEGVYGIGNKAFRQVSSAIQKVKDNTPSLIQALEASTDEDVRKFIDDFKKKNNIK